MEEIKSLNVVENYSWEGAVKKTIELHEVLI